MPAVAAGVLSIAGGRLVLALLRRHAILDRPNERSSHTIPTPRGGGLAVTPAVLAAWTLAALGLGADVWLWAMIAAGLGLMAVCWMDDRHTLPVAPRLLAQAGAVMVLTALLPAGQTVFQGWLPLWLDRAVTAIGWLWFVNLYNFMDGIDGITGVETASLGVGIAVVAALAGLSAGLVPLGLACAAAGAGFLVWNWHPARMFMGDVGSVPLGLLLGGLLIQVAAEGQLAAALVLPLYYLADATLTFTARAARGEKVWRAHRQHFYQRAVRGGRRHDQVSLAVLAGNVGLIGCAVVAAAGSPWLGLLGGVAVTALLLAALQHWSRGLTPSPGAP
ncbi:MAG: glycosyltransferase family 4 protein [Magnetospirillum sp.]|nr:glycosyltransferase family 4 protein [Magnetospirillum sp.]